MTTQKELDEEIKKLLSDYLNNKNNSVSGNNFVHLVHKLNSINEQWLIRTEEYQNNIFNDDTN